MAESDGGGSRELDNETNWQRTVFTANETFVICATGHQIVARRLDTEVHGKKIVDLVLAPNSQVVVALSGLTQNHLAIGHGGKASIYDIETATREATITGVGRSITSIAWSRHDPRLVATGLTDGSICTWSIDKPSRPVQRLISTHGVCSSLNFNPTHSDIFASGHDSVLAIWSLKNLSGPLKVIYDIPRIERLLWNPSYPGLILCSAPNHGVYIFDLLDVLDDESARDITQSAYSTIQNRDSWSSTAEDNILDNRALRQSIPCQPTDVCWYNRNSVGVLLSDCHHVCIFEPLHSVDLLYEVQTLYFPDWSGFLRVKPVGDGAIVVAVESVERSQSCVLTNYNFKEESGPIEVHPCCLTGVGEREAYHKDGLNQDVSKALRVASQQEMIPIPLARPIDTDDAEFSARTMKLHKGRSRDTESLASSEHRGRISALRELWTNDSPHRSTDEPSEIATLRQGQTSKGGFQTSSQLKRTPSIIPDPVDIQDSVASIATQASHDSDSDDESFGHGMRGSGSFMPEGVNVPIPKACGAIFAPNGQLLTFLPPRPVLARLPQKAATNVASFSRQSRLNVSRLFPSFGNLLLSSTFTEDSTDSEGSEFEGSGKYIDVALRLPNTTFADEIWLNKISPVKAVLDAEPRPPNLLLQIRDIKLLTIGPPMHNIGYRISASENEPVAEVAVSNSALAKQHGHPDAALTWTLMSLILSGQPLTASAAGANTLNLPVFRTRQDPMIDDHGHGLDLHEWRNSRHTHPFGTSWLMVALFEWAEQHADIQLLAYMSAVLLAADLAFASKLANATRALKEKSAGMQTNGVFRANHSIVLRDDNLVPILRAQPSSSPASEFSPNKAFRTSRASSRNASQPTTPFLESSLGTPPPILPGFARQISKTPVSGTASPEYHRGSFSAAARYYAQSITDKFSAYGSSPPFKKFGTSPSFETSSTLRNASGTGSWSKSVSFASTAEKTRESQLSSSLTMSHDGYDSDKTIEDSSTPHTPKGEFGDIFIQTKNDDAFDDSIKNYTTERFMPEGLVDKAVIWRRAYAEQLRTWQMFAEAAELEDHSLVVEEAHATKLHERDGMLVSCKPPSRKAVCEICSTGVTGVQQVCPICLHVTHLACLTLLLNEELAESFSCPSGCGCECMDLPFEIVDISPPVASQNSAAEYVEKKKTSFTDPRR